MTKSESWLTAGLNSVCVSLAGFKTVRHDRILPFKSKGGGLLVYIRDCYNVDASKYSHLNLYTPDIEALIVEVTRQYR